jgi:sporulation protein YlmC with PRC-barrel domain
MSGNRTASAIAMVFALAAVSPALAGGAQKVPGQATAPDVSSTTTSGSAGPAGAGQAWYNNLNADDLIGRNVTNATGDKVGEVDGVVMNPQTKDVYAVLSLGGVMGIGAKEVAVSMSELSLGTDQVLIMSTASKQQLESLPAYEEEQYVPLQGSQSLAEVPR